MYRCVYFVICYQLKLINIVGIISSYSIVRDKHIYHLKISYTIGYTGVAYIDFYNINICYHPNINILCYQIVTVVINNIWFFITILQSTNDTPLMVNIVAINIVTNYIYLLCISFFGLLSCIYLNIFTLNSWIKNVKLCISIIIGERYTLP